MLFSENKINKKEKHKYFCKYSEKFSKKINLFMLINYVQKTIKTKKFLKNFQNLILACKQGEFQCRSGECIPEAYRCDRRPDCADSSDEDHTCDSTLPTTQCSVGQWKCDDGQCIAASLKCNRRADCYDRSDENYCQNFTSACTQNDFTCTNGQCIPIGGRCNGVSDCHDYSDERGCFGELKFIFN